MTDDRMVAAARRLMELGVSRSGVVDLLGFPVETIERQLDWLPYRKCRRPVAFIVEAIRNDYSAPNLNRHAKDQTHATRKRNAVDEDAELGYRRPHAEA